MKIAHFISTFSYYELEENGTKPYTIRDRTLRADKLLEGATHVCIHKGYTKKCFVRKISHRLDWKDNIIIAWRG